MNQPDQSLTASSTGVNRRSFLRRAALSAALATPAAAYLGGGSQAHAALPYPPGPNLDLAILNFALNLEYLEGNYYSLGVTGKTLQERGVNTGSGAGGVIVKSNPKVMFTDANIKGYVSEIASDELAHVLFLQKQITAAGGTPIAQPEIDLFNSFNALAQAAGLGDSFDPFASETNFLIGGYIFEDVGVTAYAGAAGLISNSTVLTYAASILSVESYHASFLRTKLFDAGATVQDIAQKISDVRDSLDASQDTDQGVANANGTPNVVPTGVNGLTYTRTFRAVLNIVYGAQNATQGLFFPAGVNGPIKGS